MFKKAFAFFVALVIAAGLIGCNKSEDEKEKKDGTESKTQGMTTEAEPEKEAATEAETELTLDNPNIKIVIHYTEDKYKENQANFPGQYDSFYDTAAEFESRYGGKVKFIVEPWEKITEKIVAMQSSRDAPDVVSLHSQNFPMSAAKGIVQPIEQYGDVDDPVWDKGTLKAYRWKGEHYGLGLNPSPVLIIYNKTLFENYGLMTPGEYYENGEWNFDAFEMLGSEVTEDTDGDGEIDQWGFGTWGQWPPLFLISNGGHFVNFTDEGPKSGLKEPATIEALDYMQRWIKQPGGFINRNGQDGSFLEDFKNGKLAMCMGAPFPDPESEFERGAVPMPIGPSNAEKFVVGNADAYGIATGAANPEGAMAYINLIGQFGKPLMQEYNINTLDEDVLAIIQNPDTNYAISMDFNLTNIWGLLWGITQDMIDGVPAATFAEKHDPGIIDAISKTYE